MTRYLIVIFFVMFWFTIARSYGYDNEYVHQIINKNAVSQSTLTNVLDERLGYEQGIEKNLAGKRVSEWIREGAKLEDETDCRSRNHFHDPLKDWDSAGLNNLIVNAICLRLLEDPFVDSSLLWAQKTPGVLLVNNKYSWPQARDYYYKALTLTTTDEREQQLADTFRALGQVMHLLADSSVPAHVRNDIHVFPYTIPKTQMNISFGPTYESWTKANWRHLKYEAKTIDASIYNYAVPHTSAPIPISALWDQDVYTGTNPADTQTNNPVISWVGLAEFTNANFFSEDTIFQNYPHPTKERTTAKLIEQTAKDGKLDKVWYVQGYTSERLAAHSYLWKFNNATMKQEWLYNLDSFVFQDNASQLIPRAVGYSTALLDYFFRGSIEIALPDSAVYSLADTDIGFTKVTLLARNTTSTGEEMSDGSVELVASYRVAQESPFQPRDIAVTNEFSYKVVPEANGTRTIPKDTFVELAFDLGQNRIVPLNAVDVRLQIVYRGRLGNEDGAVAVGFKQVSDPTPVDLVSNTDRACINGAWYIAGSAEAIAQVDANHNGIPEWDIYPHDIADVYFKISTWQSPIDASPDTYTGHGPLLSPGIMYRSYILSDSEVSHSEYATAVRTHPADAWEHGEGGLVTGTWPGTTTKGAIQQLTDGASCAQHGTTAPCTIRRSVPFYRFRGLDLWGPLGVIFDNPEYPAGSKCSWETVR